MKIKVKWLTWCPQNQWFQLINDDDVRENLLLKHCVFFWKDKDDEDDVDIEDVEQQDVEMEEDDNDDVDVAPSIFECYLDAFDRHHATPALPVGNISNWL